MEKHRFGGVHTEQALLKIAWEGEIFGVGLFEALTQKFPEHAGVLTACATMEWLNVHLCEDAGHDAGIHVSLEDVERLGREGEAFARHSGSFDTLAHLAITETAAVDPLYERLIKGGDTPGLAQLGEDLLAHENALRDYMRSELAGESDGGAEIFAYLERHGISNDEAITPRQRRQDMGGDTQHLVLASFADEAAADAATAALKAWEKASEYLKVDAIGVLVKDEDGRVKQRKLGKTAGKKGMGVGIVLGLIAAIPTAGLSLAAGAVGGGVGGGIIGHFLHKGLDLTDDDVARINEELDGGRAMVGVLAWDFETEAIAAKLAELGGTPHRILDVTDVMTDT